MGLENRSLMQKDWLKFYKDGEVPKEPSSFAQFIATKKIPGKTLIDVGCGNGRDTYFLGTKYEALGIDPNCKPDDTILAEFRQKDFLDEIKLIRTKDIVYSRFFLHTVTWLDLDTLVANTTGYFVAEARAKGDMPVLYPQHNRYYVDGNILLDTLMVHGFEIEYFEKGRGLAPFKEEDPLLIRVIAKRVL